MEASQFQILLELLTVNQAHLRVLTQLEIDRLTKETGESKDVITERVQDLIDAALDQVGLEMLVRITK